MTRALTLSAWGVAGAALGLSAAFAPASPGRPQQPVPSRQAVPVNKELGLVAQLPVKTALDGRKAQAPSPGAKLTVVALTGLTCPICEKFGPTLALLEKELSPKGVQFIYLNPSDIEEKGDMKEKVKRLGLKGPYLHDPSQVWTHALGAKTTAEAFLLDPQGRVLYHGAVDDQYGLGASLPKPRTRFLADAVTAALAGKPVKVPATTAPGCLLPSAPEAAPAPVTFHGKVEGIIHKSCLPCHRPGGPSPFPLDTYERVKSRASMIGFAVEEGIMPPWFAAPGAGPWKNDMSLPEADRKALLEWIEGGMPKGDAAESPAKPTFVEGWTIGTPDVVLQLPRPIAIPESGTMPYQNIEVPTGFTEDKWVQKIEVIPGDKRAVHHALVFVREPGQRGVDDALDEISGFFGIYVPGNSALVYAPGQAKLIPKGSVLRFQMHYTPYGRATSDQSKIGLSFAKEPVVNEVHSASIANLMLSIPPGAERHEVTGRLRVPVEADILSYLPHMHVRGAAARYQLTRAGQTTTLLDVPRYDFDWQLNYVYQEPFRVKPGDVLTYTAWYDNSAKNPANPDPTRQVFWGLQTEDEMHLGYIEYIIPGEKPGSNAPGLRRRPAARQGGGQGVEAIFRRLDRDRDGFVTEEEAGPMWATVRQADGDKDGKVSLAEAASFFGRGRPQDPAAPPSRLFERQ